MKPHASSFQYKPKENYKSENYFLKDKIQIWYSKSSENYNEQSTNPGMTIIKTNKKTFQW